MISFCVLEIAQAVWKFKPVGVIADILLLTSGDVLAALYSSKLKAPMIIPSRKLKGPRKPDAYSVVVVEHAV